MESHRSPKCSCLKQLFTLLDVRPEKHVFAITTSTISMRQNCSISFSAALGRGQQEDPHIWATPRIIMTCRVTKCRGTVILRSMTRHVLSKEPLFGHARIRPVADPRNYKAQDFQAGFVVGKTLGQDSGK